MVRRAAVFLTSSEASKAQVRTDEDRRLFAVVANGAAAATERTLVAPLTFATGTRSLTRARIMAQLETDWDRLMLPFTPAEKLSMAERLMAHGQAGPEDVRPALTRLAQRTTAAACGSLCAARTTVLAVAPVPPTPTAPATAEAESPLLRAFTDLSTRTCYDILSGVLASPKGKGPDPVGRSIAFVNSLGLAFGIPQKVHKTMGETGLAAVSAATLGSRSTDEGDVVIAFEGRRPGCNVLLLADAAPQSATVNDGMTRAGWALVASVEDPGPDDARIFMKRDAVGTNYLMYLTTVTEPQSRVRLLARVLRGPGPKV